MWSAGITSVPHSSPEVIPGLPDLISINNSENEDDAGEIYVPLFITDLQFSVPPP